MKALFSKPSGYSNISNTHESKVNWFTVKKDAISIS